MSGSALGGTIAERHRLHAMSPASTVLGALASAPGRPLLPLDKDLHGCRQVAPLVRHLAALAGHHYPSALRFDTDPVVDRSADPLFATKVALRSLNRNVAEEELNLFQFSARCVT